MLKPYFRRIEHALSKKAESIATDRMQLLSTLLAKKLVSAKVAQLKA